jgi:hypothetical protein
LNFEHILIVHQPEQGASTIHMEAEVRDIVSILTDGLRLLAIRPQVLGQDYDDFELTPVDATGLRYQRVITRGSFVVEDSVQIADDGMSLLQSITQPEAMRGSHKRLSVELPKPGVVTLRARYESNPQSEQGALNANELRALESAYIAADQDFLRKVSELHANDMLNSLVQLHSPPFVRH